MAEVHREVARLHVRCISEGFLSSLGEKFLALLYEAIDASGSSFLIVERRDAGLIGFVAGSQGIGEVYRLMLRKPFRLGAALLPAMLSPRKTWRILEILLHSRRNDSGAVAGPRAELLSIAVDPGARGAGVADNLYKQLVERFQSAEAQGFRIVVGEALASAHSFYRRMGAVPSGTLYVHGKNPSVLYIHSLDRDKGGGNE